MNPEPITVAWYEHAATVPAAAWALPGASSAGLCLPYLRALQEGGLSFVRGFRYATASADGQVVGCLVAFLVEAEDEELLGPGPLRVLILSDAMGMCRPPVMVKGATAAERRSVLDALLGAAIERARTEQAEGVHAYWIGEGAVELSGALASRGFAAIPEEHCAYVPLLAGERNPYPTALRSSYRNVIKRKHKELSALGLFIAPPAAPPAPALLERLYTEVAERKEQEHRELTESRFSRQFFALALEHPAFRLYVCGRPFEEPLGYLLGVQSGDTFISLAVGLGYDRITALGGPGLCAAVYQVLHVEALARAQAEGARWAALGISALAGKARLGALCERNSGMGLGFTERAWDALHRARAALPLGDEIPACRPYPEDAWKSINAEASRRAIRLTISSREEGL